MLINPPPPEAWTLRDLADMCRGAWIVITDRDRHYLQDVIDALPTMFLVVFGIVCIALGFVAGIAFGYLLRGL